MKVLVQRAISWVFLAAWIGVIFWFSSQPDLKSGLETWQDVVLRKAAHMTEYFVLAYLALRCFAPSRPYRWEALGGAAFFAAAVAVADENYQRTVVGRHGSPWDVGIDALGAIVLVALEISRSARRPTHQER